MAWEWVSPVAIVTAGAMGVFFTWLSGQQARNHAERISNAQLANERQLAKEAREQERLENAYIQLLHTAELVGQWAESVLLMWDTDPPQPERPLPPLEEQVQTQALVAAFGSEAVRKYTRGWLTVVRAMQRTVQRIQCEEADPTRRSGENPRILLEKLREQERETREALEERVAIELGHRRQAEGMMKPGAFTVPGRRPLVLGQILIEPAPTAARWHGRRIAFRCGGTRPADR